MKKIGLFILSLFTIFLVGNYTQAKDYEYTNLDITANILEDGTIDIKEDFTANFFVDKHGIIRDIPLNYSVGGDDFHIEVSNINVQGKNFTTDKSNGNIEIKIGDADRTLIGKQNYPISYSVYGLIRNFSGMGYAELYWNLVGYDFDTNINKVRAEIILPKAYTGFTKDDFLITTDGKSKTIDGFEGSVDWSQGNKIIITYDKGLSAKQGITLAIKFPNNYFEFNHNKQKNIVGHIGGDDNNSDTILSKIFGIFLGFCGWIEGIKNNGSTIEILPILYITYLLIGLIFSLIKKTIQFIFSFPKRIKEKRYYQNKYPIIIQYNPPQGFNPAEVGMIYNEGEVFMRDILSFIYKWASDGYLKIEEESDNNHIHVGNKYIKSKNKDKKIVITKIKEISNKTSKKYEQEIFKNLFPNKCIIIDSNTKLYDKLKTIGNSLLNYGINQGRIYIKKENFANLFGRIGIITLIMLIVWIPIQVGTKYRILEMFILLLLFVICTSTYELLLTDKGKELKSHIEGYKKFLKTCDENQLREFLRQDSTYFDKILPYAIIFGLDTELIKKIQPISKEMDIKSNRHDGDLNDVLNIISTINTAGNNSSYESSRGHTGGSSFDSGGSSFDSGGGGGGGGGSSW